MKNIWGFSCFHCHRRLAIASHGICSKCYKAIEKTDYCGRCGRNLPENRLGCGNCLQNEPKWHRLVRVSTYQPPLTQWIHQFKFQKRYYWDNTLARLLLLAVKNAQREHDLNLPEVIMPVPLFWKRHWQRGYNQAQLLAQQLSYWLNIPVDNVSLQRIKHTKPQLNLTASDRLHNVRESFDYQPLKSYQRIALVDDVVTTGATLNAICLTLYPYHIPEIQVWTLARA